MLKLTLGLCLTHAVEIIMSFGFGIGDFIAVGELCWKLYSQVYKVSRDAPEELRGLNQELGNFHNTIRLLIEELKDRDSVLRNSGDARIDNVRRVMSHSEETLKKMQQLSERYADLQSSSTAQDKRRMLRIYWDRLKYTRELHSINDLRSKVMLHNSQLALVLQGAQKTYRATECANRQKVGRAATTNRV
ncbi:hypothetical protein MKX08_009407 [Trichoderma sp. CBMAI-0020]|nr:hypothetical protein MKX08_009407 [Trichoderma sp. CBMAI-0020]